MSDFFEVMKLAKDLQKAEKEMQAKYRLLFLNGIGKDVLSDILGMCHFGATLDPDNPAQIAEHNVGIVILARCGVIGPGAQMEDVVTALSNVMPKQEEVEK